MELQYMQEFNEHAHNGGQVVCAPQSNTKITEAKMHVQNSQLIGEKNTSQQEQTKGVFTENIKENDFLSFTWNSLCGNAFQQEENEFVKLKLISST